MEQTNYSRSYPVPEKVLLGAVRVSHAMRKRTRAEREIDQTRKGIFEFCEPEQWQKSEEKE